MHRYFAGIVWMFLLVGAASAQPNKVVGIVSDAQSLDYDITVKLLVDDLTKRRFSTIADSTFDIPTLAYKTKRLIEVDRVDALVVSASRAPAALVLARVINEYDLKIPIISLGVPIEDRRAFGVTYNHDMIGRLQIEALAQTGIKKIALINRASQSRAMLQVGVGQMRALRDMKNIDIVADCGTCPATGDCPKSQAQATECPCPSTGDCPKSSVANFLSRKDIDGVATLDPWFVDVVRDAAKEIGKPNLLVVGPSASRADLEGVAMGSRRGVVWQDPSQLAAKAAEVASNLLAGTPPASVTGAASVNLTDGSKMYSILLNPRIVQDASDADGVLRTLRSH
jgi:ABC-type xylose transport system substrate-binding protein